MSPVFTGTPFSRGRGGAVAVPLEQVATTLKDEPFSSSSLWLFSARSIAVAAGAVAVMLLPPPLLTVIVIACPPPSSA